MEILPVTSNGPDIILGPTPMKLSQFKLRAIALISVRLDWLYSSSPRKIHEVRDQGMEELPLAQPNSCYWIVGWCLAFGVFFPSLMKVMNSELQPYCRKGYVLLRQYRLTHRMQTGTPSIRAGGRNLGTPSHVPQLPVQSCNILQKKNPVKCCNRLK